MGNETNKQSDLGFGFTGPEDEDAPVGGVLAYVLPDAVGAEGGGVFLRALTETLFARGGAIPGNLVAMELACQFIDQHAERAIENNDEGDVRMKMIHIRLHISTVLGLIDTLEEKSNDG